MSALKFGLGIAFGAMLASTLGACSSLLGVTDIVGAADEGGGGAADGAGGGAADGAGVDATTDDANGPAGDSAADASGELSDSAADAPGPILGCLIGGQAYTSGAVNPSNPCESCQPATSATSWSSNPLGATCGAGEVCNTTKTCSAGCFVGGSVVAPNAVSASNACQSCQPNVSTTAWSTLRDGTACGAGGAMICNQGACGSGCVIGGIVYAANAAKPGEPCQTCKPATSTTTWTNVGNGTACGNGQTCAGGACGTQCDIQGSIFPPGERNPANACEVCEPGTNTTNWSNLSEGSPCGGGEICHAVSCVPGCYVSGQFYAPGAANPNTACQTCQPSVNTTAFSNLTDGTACTGGICRAGSCGGGCEIAGTFYTTGQLNPSNACQSCQPARSTTTWSSLGNGSGCAAGMVCNAGNCVAGCYIIGYITATFYAPNAANPANACQSCQPATSTADWSNAASGLTCNDGNNCTYNDVCNGAGGCAGTSYSCSASSECTTSSCDGAGGCTTTINTGAMCGHCGTCSPTGSCDGTCKPIEMCCYPGCAAPGACP